MGLISSFDIISCQETWSSDSVYCDKYVKDFTHFECNAKPSVAGGRMMGGVSVFVHQSICEHVKRICDDFEFGVILDIDKSFFGLDKNCIYCALYFPPEGLPFYNDIHISPWVAFEDILIQNNLCGLNILINGDLNSRTGQCLDYIESGDDFLSELDEFRDIFEYNSALPRSSRDNTINKAGRELLKFCKTFSCSIVNGRVGHDKDVGDFTFINQNGSSVVDYFIVSNNLVNQIVDFNILLRPESCHMPISLVMKSLKRVATDACATPYTFYDWSETNISTYTTDIHNTVLSGVFDKIDDLIDDTNVNINFVLIEFENAIKGCSESIKRTKIRQLKIKQSWFDNECRLQKRKTINCLKRFRSSRSVNDFNNYITYKKHLRRYVRKKEVNTNRYLSLD